MTKTNLIQKMGLLDNLDDPIPFKTGWFGKKGLLIMIIYEDQSYGFYKRKLKKNYFVTIKTKNYFLYPRCFLKGAKSIIVYYYNNPIPIELKFQHTSLNASSIRTESELKKLADGQRKQLENIKIDAEALQSAFSSNLINKMYSENNFFTLKNILIITFAVLFIILLILQLTGTVDVMGLISGSAQAKGG